MGPLEGKLQVCRTERDVYTQTARITMRMGGLRYHEWHGHCVPGVMLFVHHRFPEVIKVDFS